MKSERKEFFLMFTNIIRKTFNLWSYSIQYQFYTTQFNKIFNNIWSRISDAARWKLYFKIETKKFYFKHLGENAYKNRN